LPRLYYLGWSQYGELVTKLSELVAAYDERFDLVIGIARGGMPVAMVIADRLGIKVDFLNVKSYTDVGERTKPKILSTITEEIRDKRILVVDDLVDGGDTMESITEYLATQNPSVMKTAVLFTKPWSSFKPDFSLKVVDNWIVFPYERGEVRRSRAQKKQQTLAPPTQRAEELTAAR
jgi:uncharacterized protein